MAVAVGLFVTGLGVFAGQLTPPVPTRTATVTVGEGQSLWDVAHQYAPDADANAVVARIRQLNNLGGDAVVPGLPLTVPVDAAPLGASR
ncbi:LysM peptidoglycan-binding domain-containing protein [Amycolatopsis bartoniae]|nr:LysM peptidoglycan-binding domain-containing protein [Amycolatopsis bartoniae]